MSAHIGVLVGQSRAEEMRGLSGHEVVGRGVLEVMEDDEDADGFAGPAKAVDEEEGHGPIFKWRFFADWMA